MAERTQDEGCMTGAPLSSVLHLPSLKEHLVNGGRIERDGDILRLVILPTTSVAYADAQLDDYGHEPPRAFLHAPPQHLHIRARFSHPAGVMKGTAGFGFWNHPFTREGSVLEPPRNVWFFYGSPESNMQIARGMPGHGLKAAMLDSLPVAGGQWSVAGGGFSNVMRHASSVLNVLLRSHLMARAAMAAARAVIHAHETMLNIDMTQWHDYELDWLPDAAIFCVDGQEVLRAPKPPRNSMGFVAWVDNYRATATPDGQYEFAYVDVPEMQWMELIFTQA